MDHSLNNYMQLNICVHAAFVHHICAVHISKENQGRIYKTCVTAIFVVGVISFNCKFKENQYLWNKIGADS